MAAFCFYWDLSTSSISGVHNANEMPVVMIFFLGDGDGTFKLHATRQSFTKFAYVVDCTPGFVIYVIVLNIDIFKLICIAHLCYATST
jgi:hypothetical protein